MTAADRARAMRERRAGDQAQLDERAQVTKSPKELPDKVRQTVDLTGEADQKFAAWRLDAALNLGWRQLTTQAALAAIVDVLLEDEVVARRVVAYMEGLDEDQIRALRGKGGPAAGRR